MNNFQKKSAPNFMTSLFSKQQDKHFKVFLKKRKERLKNTAEKRQTQLAAKVKAGFH